MLVTLATPNNVFVVEEDVARMGMVQVQEAPVSLIPGNNQVPDPNSATAILGKGNLSLVFIAKRTIISKRSVLLELKTIHLVSEMMALPTILPKVTNNSPTIPVMRVRASCIRFFSCRLNDPSH